MVIQYILLFSARVHSFYKFPGRKYVAHLNISRDMMTWGSFSHFWTVLVVRKIISPVEFKLAKAILATYALTEGILCLKRKKEITQLNNSLKKNLLIRKYLGHTWTF